MTKREKLEAQLKMEILEEEFKAKKDDGTVTTDDKHDIREARQDYRDNVRSPVQVGAQPRTTGTSGDVKSVGAKT